VTEPMCILIAVLFCFVLFCFSFRVVDGGTTCSGN
jgi:hypothetical protein